MTSRRSSYLPKPWFRLIGAVLVPILFFGSAANASAEVIATNGEGNVALSTSLASVAVNANRTGPQVSAPSASLEFSSMPTGIEISKASVAGERLIPASVPASAEENKALAQMLMAHSKRSNGEDVSALEGFLASNPNSRWRISLLAGLATSYFKTGFFSKALASWEEAWALGKDEKNPELRAVVDRVGAELAKMNARIGRFDRLDPLLKELAGREIHGSATELITGAAEGLWLMKNRPEDAFRCGPMAAATLYRLSTPGGRLDPRLQSAKSTSSGTSLFQVNELMNSLGMNYQMAKRDSGALVIIPSVVNWKVGHFAALVKREGERYLVQDPTFGEDIWVTQSALDSEASGYFVVRSGKLPSGWHSVDSVEGKTVWGKGNTGSSDPDPTKPCDTKTDDCASCGGGGSPGMARYNVHAMLVSLNIVDTPLFYTPPRGPSVNFTVTYNQRDANQPATFPFSNFGPKWTVDWLSYLTDNSTNPSADIKLYVQGGGAETYTGFNSATQSYAPQLYNQAVLVRLSPTSYERRLSDGSKELFDFPDGTVGAGRRVFLRRITDAAGNSLTFTYDASFRLAATTDAIGEVTTFSYELAGDPLKVTKITDPFSRSALFEYTAGQLTKITDVAGLVSQFTYGTGQKADFITSLTTPYGTTTFRYADVNTDPGLDYRTRWLETTDPLGGKERVEFNELTTIGIPFSLTDPMPAGMYERNRVMYARNTFFWSKKAMMEAPGDYSKAKLFHWLHDNGYAQSGAIIESEKKPLEARVWYNYPGQPYGSVTYNSLDEGATLTGTSNLPTKVGRVLDDGTTQLYQYEYNSIGKVTKKIDPLGRVTSYKYDTNNIDLLEVYQQNPQGSSTDPFGAAADKLATYTYNTLHEPLTSTDASGQTTTYTYNSQGQLLTIENPKHEVTTRAYNPTGYLMSVTGALPGSTTAFTYDGFGRQRTVVDSEGYTVTTEYDNLNRVTKVTYPDGTYEQIIYNRLDPEWKRDRLGRWTHNFYDPLQHLVGTEDPALRLTRYNWCTCGSLESIIDPDGNKTTWTRDVQSRVTSKIYPDNTSMVYAYENTTSRLTSMTDAKSQGTNYAYFTDDRLKQISYTGAQIPTPTVTYAYDAVYNRVVSMTDGTGLTTYAYNPVAASSVLGSGMLASVNEPLANDTITYGYDELGRPTNRSVNGAANATSTVYDSLGRVTSAGTPLGSFNYAYVSTTPRLDHTNYPNGQISQYIYFGNTGDQRLQEIWNKTSSGATISKFDYTYNAVGDIVSWSQKAGASTPFVHSFGYDGVDQLLGDTVTLSGATQHQYSYRYDRAGNRTSEQIDSSVNSASYNNLNQLTSRSGGGQMTFEGTLNEPGTVAIAGGSPAPTDGSNHFKLAAPVTIGSNSIPIVATDASGNATSNHIQLTVTGTGSQTLTYDLNGNLLSDGANTYEWDAANRLVAVNEPGNLRSEFTYNGLSQQVKIIEKANGSVTSTKQLVWCPGDAQPCEERDASNNVTKRYYSQGMRIGSTNYYYTRDHLGSVRELTNGSGTVQTRYDYDPYGRRTKLSGSLDADFGFTGHYYHQPSGLNLALYRAYDADFGRWISRDPIGEAGGINFYDYVFNNPISLIDRLGLSEAVFDGSNNTITVTTNNGQRIVYPAGNDTVNPTGNPNQVGSNGPAPNGTYPVQPPVMDPTPAAAYGPVFYPVGAVGSNGERLDIARQRGIGIHGGRDGFFSPTHGCIRMNNQDITNLTNLLRALNDTLTRITIHN